MSTTISRIAQWLANKLFVLLLIIGILVGGLWLQAEWKHIQERLADARWNDSLATRLEEDVASLEVRRAEFESQLAEISGQLASYQKIMEEARRAELLASQVLEATRNEGRWWYTKWTHPEYYLRIEAAELILRAAENGTSVATIDHDRIREALTSSPVGVELIQIRNEISARQKDVEDLHKRAEFFRSEAAQRPIEKLRAKIVQVLPSALLVLLGVILAPLCIKALLYFIVAPMISKARPVVMVEESEGVLEVSQSAVSVPLTLEPGDQLIVHSDFLQAAGAGPGKATKFLFSWRMPLTSMAAGLFLMVSVKNPSQELQKVTVSPKKELFDKLCNIRIPEGSSMVVYPRSLVGLVISQGHYPRITRHWKLDNLHSWITFQFRYIVIHGQARLLIKGCRGVRADQVEPGKPRQQDQCATLGFSANLAYSGVRCETFVDYLLGRDGLFNDRFSDATGFYLTEEIPDPRQKTGLFGRGLEGLMDGMLKAFGI